MQPELRPTIWRTCRVLAHPGRLQVLGRVIARREACVSQLAADCALAPNKATEHLRALQARGLIRAWRQSRWTFYSARPDPLVQHAAAILEAARAALRRGDTPARMRAAFTAFTHPRRSHIVQLLAQTPGLDATTIAARCHQSLPAASRHLTHLVARDVLACDDAGAFRLAPAPHPLVRDLLNVVLADSEPPPAAPPEPPATRTRGTP